MLLLIRCSIHMRRGGLLDDMENNVGSILFLGMRVLGYLDADIYFRCFSTPYYRMRALLSFFLFPFSFFFYLLLFGRCLSWFSFAMSFFHGNMGVC